MALTPGARLGLYQIVALLGAGGMGEVYRARDQKLDRDVAIKVLPPSVAADPDTLVRFEREAKAVAALSHPNILSIFDFGAHDGISYAVMELLEGETLRGRLDAGPIAQKQAVDYALQVARGLSAAHGKGIVHRDLKPENLFITRDGHLKILDFGLAKRVERAAPGDEMGAPTVSGHTEPGTIMGTAGYMSPEQVKGLQVDHRSDIFSFGTILYELLSGKRAFKRETNAETMAAIMRDEPPELSESGRSISPALDRIVKHCLEKDREHRFQAARDIAFNLLEQSSTSVASDARGVSPPISAAGFWVAVLPFKFSGANEDLAALADGLSEDIVTGVSRFSYLRVVARGSTSRYASESVDVRTAGKELGARYVMEGHLRQAGAKLRVAVQLVDAESGAHLWAESYERIYSQNTVFELQDDLVPRIVSTCADRFGVLARSISDAVRSGEPGQVGPYEALMRGFGYHQRLTPAEHAEARDALERAVERAPSNADCWAMLSWVYSHEYAHGFNVRPSSLARALTAARRAVDIAPSNQLAQQALAVVLFFRKETAGCLSAAERAIALNPLDASNEAIFLITFTGNWERGCALIRRAMELNPHHPRWYGTILGLNEYRLTEYRAAVDEVVKANAPDIFWANMLLAAAHGQLSDYAAARNALRDLLAQKPDFARSAAELLDKWFEPQLVGSLMEGLRRAGLAVAGEEDRGTAPSALDGAHTGAADSSISRAEEGFWVAVLPFKYGGANADLTALANGLSEDVVTGLSRFPYLRVIARSSTSRYANDAVDVRTAGKELGARYVMEGNLRLAGTKLRLAVQVVDAISGAHLWAENYERPFSPEAVFELQDDLVPRIVSTVADSSGVLPHSISQMLRTKSPDQLSPYEAVLRYFGYLERATPEEHAKAREALERAVETAPDEASCWATLAMVYRDEHTHGFNLRPDPLGRALAAAHRAVEAAPSNHLAHQALACALFFRREIVAFRSAAERTLALNPMDSSTAAYLGILLLHAGDWDRGCALVERARQLNPNHPGWYWFAPFWDAYRKRDYRGALDVALKINMPGDFYVPAVIAAAHGQLGELESARAAVVQLLAMKPHFAATAREDLEKWFGTGEIVEHFLDGLRKAGLDIALPEIAGGAAPDRVRSAADSVPVRAEDGFWIAVLPFKYSGANPDLTALADGLSEDIVTGLSRFSYLRVIARSSTSRYANDAVDVRTAGKELGARYVMEGNLRQSRGKLRVAVQLVDAVSGAHLWAENYERTFSPEAVFELQDDLVPRIVSTVADTSGVLPHSISEMLRRRGPDQLSPNEAVLRSFGYYERITPEEHAIVTGVLEWAVDNAPEQADCWAMLSMMYKDEYTHGFNVRPDSLGRALAAAHRAVEAAPSNHLAHHALATALFFRRELAAFRHSAERTIALNPMDGGTTAFVGHLMAYAGDWEGGCALVEHARQLNPNHPGWYWFPAYFDAYRKRDYRGALEAALKINMPGYFYASAVIAAAYAQLGEGEAARTALLQLLARKPDFAAAAREELGKWFGPSELLEHFLDGLRKAGLEIAPLEGATAQASDRARSSPADSGAVRAEDGFWVAVLPFKYSGANADLTALAEGLSEDIVAGLSRFSYLKVIARSSTTRYANETVDGRSAGSELGARYVMEGTLRQAGEKLRLAVQLVDAASGAHLWAEHYERTFSQGLVFELQDELVPRIVSTVADWYGILPHSMSEAVRHKPVDQLSPYEALLRGFGYYERVTPEEHAVVRPVLERAVAQSPGYAAAWAMLSMVYGEEHRFGFNAEPDSLDRSLQAAQRAAEAAPSSHFSHLALAQAHYFRKEFEAFRNTAERAIVLNPTDGATLQYLAHLLAFAGDWERGCDLGDRARDLNPHHPEWYWALPFLNAYRKGDYLGARAFMPKAGMPGQYYSLALFAALCGQLGEQEAAARARRDLLVLKPDFALIARDQFGKWYLPNLVEQLIDGLRKAGLDVPGPALPDPVKPD